jgi:hypothetical protein
MKNELEAFIWALASVCCSRVRAMLVKAAARLGGCVASRLRTIERRL